MSETSKYFSTAVFAFMSEESQKTQWLEDFQESAQSFKPRKHRYANPFICWSIMIMVGHMRVTKKAGSIQPEFTLSGMPLGSLR